VVILLVGVARVVLRAHWPSDVLAGIALGLALAAAAGWVASTLGSHERG
jgi:membrane-associated phospholipid phosphatase